MLDILACRVTPCQQLYYTFLIMSDQLKSTTVRVRGTNHLREKKYTVQMRLQKQNSVQVCPESRHPLPTRPRQKVLLVNEALELIHLVMAQGMLLTESFNG